jgi:hypothetical protein
MTDIIDEVLKYCGSEYNYVVFKEGEGYGFDDEFWTLEKTEEEAIQRVKIETEAYDDPEWQFLYKPLKREEVKYYRKATSVIETKVVW